MTAAPDAIPTRTAAVAWQIIVDELVLLRVEEEELVGINQVGADVWQLVDGERSVGEIARSVAGIYDVDDATASADTAAFLEELRVLGAIELRGPSA